MKKVLLTTTALVMTAGVAAAEVSFSGTSQVSVSATGNGDNELNSHIDFNVAVSGTYDNGMTMSTSFGYDAGRQADYNDDFATDPAETGWGTAAPESAMFKSVCVFTSLPAPCVSDMLTCAVPLNDTSAAATPAVITNAVVVRRTFFMFSTF